MPKYKHKIDKNQPEIVATLREEGLRVAVTSRAGFGIPDLIVMWPGNPSSMRWVEVKSPGGSLTEREAKFYDDWSPAVIIAFNAVQVMAIMEELC